MNRLSWDWIFKDFNAGYCEFYDHCRLSRQNNSICTKMNGNAYGNWIEPHYGGCYRDLAANGQRSRYWKD